MSIFGLAGGLLAAVGASAENIHCDIGGGIGRFCEMGRSNTIELAIHHPVGKACIFLSTKKVTTRKLREVLGGLKDTGEFDLAFKVVPPGIEFRTPVGGFMTQMRLQTRSLNPFSEDIDRVIAEPGETDVHAYVAAHGCNEKGTR